MVTLTSASSAPALRPLLLDRVPHCADLIATAPGEVAPGEIAALRAAETIGRPLGGDAAFLDRTEALQGRPVRPGKRGPRSASDIAGRI